MADQPPSLCGLACGRCGQVRRMKDFNVIRMAQYILIQRGRRDLADAIAATDPNAVAAASASANVNVDASAHVSVNANANSSSVSDNFG